MDDSGYLGAKIAYGVTPWMAIGFESGWQEAGTAANFDEDVGRVVLMGDLFWRIPVRNNQFWNWTVENPMFVPYVVLGMGTVTTYVTNAPPPATNTNGDDEDDTVFGWKIGGGVDWFVNEHWAMNIEISYLNNEPHLTGTTVSLNQLDFWTLGGGLKYVY